MLWTCVVSCLCCVSAVGALLASPLMLRRDGHEGPSALTVFPLVFFRRGRVVTSHAPSWECHLRSIVLTVHGCSGTTEQCMSSAKQDFVVRVMCVVVGGHCRNVEGSLQSVVFAESNPSEITTNTTHPESGPQKRQPPNSETTWLLEVEAEVHADGYLTSSALTTLGCRRRGTQPSGTTPGREMFRGSRPASSQRDLDSGMHLHSLCDELVDRNTRSGGRQDEANSESNAKAPCWNTTFRIMHRIARRPHLGGSRD